MAKKKRQLPDDSHIESKLGSLESRIRGIADGDMSELSNKNTVTHKLMLAKDILLILKDKRVPYRILCKIIEEEIDVKVSEQTLRHFCQNKLGFPKTNRKNKTSLESRDLPHRTDNINKHNDNDTITNKLSDSNIDFD